jgi:hypothetical protein
MEASVLHEPKKKREKRKRKEKEFEKLLQSIEPVKKACRPGGVVFGSAARQI